MDVTSSCEMQNWMLTILSGIGLTFIVTQSWLFKWLQKWHLFQCSMCFGFWAGCLVRLIEIQCFKIDILLYGFSCSILSYIVYLLLQPLIKKYD